MGKMWKILALVVFCGLLSPSEGKPPGIRCVFSPGEITNILVSSIQQNGLLQNHLKGIVLPDIEIGGLLSLLTKVSGLQVVNAQITGRSRVLLPEIIGVDLSLTFRLDITGNILLSGIASTVNISLDVKFRVKYGLTNFVGGFLDVVFVECGCEFGVINISVLSGLLSVSVQAAIQESVTSNINHQICPIMTAVFDVVKETLLDTMNVNLLIGPSGNLKCQLASMPHLAETFVGIDIYVDVEVVGKGIFSIPDDVISIEVPLLQNYRHCQALHPAFLNIVLGAFVVIQPQELSCTPDAFSGAVGLRDAIVSLIPPGASGITSTTVLYLRISVLEGPKIDLGSGRAIMRLTMQIDVFIRNVDGTISTILVLKGFLSLDAAVSVVSGRLILATSLLSHDLLLVSSDVGITQVSTLAPYCNSLLSEIFLPVLNGHFDKGIPLLAVMGTALVNVDIQIAQGALLLYI